MAPHPSKSGPSLVTVARRTRGVSRCGVLAEPLAVAAQEEARILATADGWDVIQDVATPVANTDYQATNNADGTGADATGWITVAPLAEAQSGVSGSGA